MLAQVRFMTPFCLTRTPKRPQVALRGKKYYLQNGFQYGQYGPKWLPRRSQDASKTAKMASRELKMASRCLQDVPRRPQGGPRCSQDGPTGLQEGPGRPNLIGIIVFFNVFNKLAVPSSRQPRTSKRFPKLLQDGPSGPEKVPKATSRGSKMASKAVKIA